MKGLDSVGAAVPARGRWSMARRLTLLFAASSLAMLVLATTYLHWSLAVDLERDETAFLANKLEECRRLLRDRPENAALLAHEVQSEAEESHFIKYFVRIADAGGQVLLETPGMTRALPVTLFPVPISLEELPSAGTVRPGPAGKAYLTMAGLAELNSEPRSKRIIQVAIDVTGDEALLAAYRLKAFAVIAGGVFFSCTVGFLVARRGLRPLMEMAAATGRITANQLEERIVTDGWPEELAALAVSFDRMLERLDDSFKRLSRFSADLAHELRTPINNLRCGASIALSQPRMAGEYRGALESCLEEGVRLGRLIDNMLFLARAEKPDACVARKSFQSSEAIRAVCEYYEALAEDRRVTVSHEGQAVVSADPILFRQAVSNLLSNALNNTTAGGTIRIEVAPHGQGGLRLAMIDSGCGIPDEHLPRIFDRLYRVDPARAADQNGAGLGLAIVRSIMTLHGGSAEVTSVVGQGSRFVLLFPPAPPQPREASRS